MNVYELQWNSQDEKEWIAANTVIHALKTYCAITSMDIVELEDDDEIIEVPREKWSELVIRNTDYNEDDPDDWEHQTIEQWMKDNHRADIIAGTMYE